MLDLQLFLLRLFQFCAVYPNLLIIILKFTKDGLLLSLDVGYIQGSSHKIILKKSFRSCLSGFTHFVKLVGSNTFFNCYFWTRVIGFILLPSFLLIVLNVLLIRGIRQVQLRKNRLLKYIFLFYVTYIFNELLLYNYIIVSINCCYVLNNLA